MKSNWFIFFVVNIYFIHIHITQSILSFPGLTFEATTTETFSSGAYEIGWIKFLSCEEGFASSADYSPYTLQQLIDIAQYAVTIKILNHKSIDPNNGGSIVSTPGSFEDENYAIKADICSSPIFSLNNGYELSFQIDPNDIPSITAAINTNDWIGTTTALNRLQNHVCDSRTSQVISSARKLSDGIFYDACGNQNEPLYVTTTDSFFGFFGGVCQWSMRFPPVDFDKDIAIWFGFDKNEVECCKMDNNNAYEYKQCFTASPTTIPTNPPTVPHIPISCMSGMLSSPSKCWQPMIDANMDKMVACGFLEYLGEIPERVYFDSKDENKCSLDATENRDSNGALSITHCCDIPDNVGFSCNYYSKTELIATIASVDCVGANEIAIGCQAVGPSCVGHSDCGDLINIAVNNFDNGYYYETITNNICTAHEQNIYNGVIKVQSTCCSITNIDYTLECKQVVGTLSTVSIGKLSCKQALGQEWFVTGCSGYIEGQENQEDGAVVEGFYPSGNACIIRVDRSDNRPSAGTYPIAQCCRIVEN